MSESKIGRGSLTGNVLRGMTSSSTTKDQRDKEQPGLIPMSLFAAWDADRTPPNCVPRLCSLTLSRLTVLKPLGADISSITLAVKMQNSKRTLRSNEIALPVGQQLLDTELDLSFALQYPHYLKQWDSGNRLQIMLQRRKRYKNRTILGFKTLCSGTINMASAMQRTMDMELELYSEGTAKEGNKESISSNVGGSNVGGVGLSAPDKVGSILLAKVMVQSLSSQPVDHEEAAERLKAMSGYGDGAGASVGGIGSRGGASGAGAGTGFIRYVDDVDEDEFSSNEENSDSDRVGPRMTAGAAGAPNSSASVPAKSRGKIPTNARQRNLKQKFIALLKRFKITEDLDEHELVGEGGIDPSKLTEGDLEIDAGDIDDLIDELEDLSDSGPEMDTLSVTSTPKPSLRPFFASSRSLLAPDPSSSSSVFTFPSAGYADHMARTGMSLLERHYSDESSKRVGGGTGDSGDSHPESLWGTDQERESDTPTAAQQYNASPFFTSSSPPRSGFVSGPLLSTSTQQQEDKTKEVKRNRLFNRERSGPSMTTSNSSALPLNEKSAVTACSSSRKCHSVTSGRDTKINEASPRKILLEQLSRCMPADDALPDHVILVSGSDLQGCNLAGRLAERQQRVLNTIGAADVRATIGCLASKIQKFCNCSAKPPPPIKVVLIGNDAYINSVLRSYVEQFNSKPPDWKNHLKFYIVPLSTSSLSSGNNSVPLSLSGNSHTLARYLASLDRYYSVNFVSDSWREALDRPTDKMLLPGVNGETGGASSAAVSPTKIDVQEVIHRLGRYLTSNGSTVQIPIAEAMITYREPGSEEESTQVFIPFVSEVRIGISEVAIVQSPAQSSSTNSALPAAPLESQSEQSADAGQLQVASTLSGSPPTPSPLLLSVNTSNGMNSVGDRGTDRERSNRVTPPSSPNISSMHSTKEFLSGESVELQVDYWLSGASAIAAAAAARESGSTASSKAGETTIGGLAATMAQAVSKSRGGGGGGSGGGEGKSSAGPEPSSVKYTVKAGFRWIVVQRLPSSPSVNPSSSSATSSSTDSSSLFTMTFGLKEKKQKIMRLGKKKSDKEKDSESSKSQVVEGINRLVCQAKTHHSLLKVVIDGVEWNNVKFFQLSSQWQTHIRHFPVALFTE